MKLGQNTSCAHHFDQVLWLFEKNWDFLSIPTFGLNSIYFGSYLMNFWLISDIFVSAVESKESEKT